jgi:S-adenosylmethionine:tRNA ribosyltransferase-isomerase
MSAILSDYHYDLPRELISDRPALKREDSRMMVLDRCHKSISHHKFSDLTGFLSERDLLVLNDSRVIPARLHDSSGKIEVFLLEKITESRWIAMVKPGKKMKIGSMVEIAGTKARVLEVMEDGTRLMEFDSPPDLETHGSMPIPPYFRREADEADRERYQTVYARDPGSVAAPTAGLHFTQQILRTLPHEFLTLHVGAGTFQPVKSEDLSTHKMHSEHYTLPVKTAVRINSTKDRGGHVICVGTTTARVLESQPEGPLAGRSGTTDIFIRPPRQLQRVDALLTNFHLPESTLLMLVSAFAGRNFIMEAYQEAIRERYRFFSYGDCMLIQ